MQSYVPKRSFTATNVKSICLLANSRQADLIGSKIMQNLRRVSNDTVEFHGYGGDWMKKEGFEPTVDFDIDLMQDKQFHTYRKTKTAHEAIYYKWNPLNLVNKAYVRKTDDVFENVSCCCREDRASLISVLFHAFLDDESGCAQEDLPKSSGRDLEHRQRVHDLPAHGRNQE